MSIYDYSERHRIGLEGIIRGEEIWFDHPVIDGWQFSNFGRGRTQYRRSYKIKRKQGFWTVVEPHISAYGYEQLCIEKRQYFVHVLVLETFSGPRPDKADTRHLDDIKLNNKLDNLVWGTRAENLADGFANGRYPRGEKHYASKLTEENVLEIRRLRLEGWSVPKLAKRYGVDYTIAYGIIKGTRWRHVK